MRRRKRHSSRAKTSLTSEKNSEHRSLIIPMLKPTAMPLDCVLIGQGTSLTACADILLRRGHRVGKLVSNCPVASAWAQRKGIDRVDPAEPLAGALSREPFDLLFSIVNHAITPAEVLALPRLGAMNFHDSLLPSYSGFNATAWALLDGRTEHGVTWHRMTADVDAGAALLQEVLPISEDDTAFSLAARASEAAVRSFETLMASIESGTLRETPAQAARDFHFKSDRPGFAVLDFAQPPAALLRTVRALDFGTEDSWMTRAKLRTPAGEYVCVGRASALPASGASAGTVGQVSAVGVEVAAAGGSILLSELSAIDGAPLDRSRLDRLGLVPGARLPAHDTGTAEQATAFDRRVTKGERYWQRKLAQRANPSLSELKPHAATGTLDRLSVDLPDALPGMGDAAVRANVLAAVAVYVVRVGEEIGRVDLGLRVEGMADELGELYSRWVPASLALVADARWADVVKLAGAELDECAGRQTFARDLWTRCAVLGRKAEADRRCPVAVAFSDKADVMPSDGVCLLVVCRPGARHLEWVFDTGAIGRLHVQRLASRVAHLLSDAAARSGEALSALSIVTPEEQQLLLHTFQDTARPNVRPRCIHELFAAQVARTPGQVALAFRDEQITYRELDERSSALAARLQALGVGPDQLVAVSIERSIDMVVGLLATLKAGGAYVPLDPAYPQERLSIMLEDSGARWLLTQRHLASRLPRHGAEVVLVDESAASSKAAALNETGVEPQNLAYVIFTSGSTGRPKGVMIEHRQVANFFAGMDETVGPEPGVWLAVTSISFDISVLEIFWTLTRGFEVVIQEEGDRASMQKAQTQVKATARPMDFGLFYFAADSTNAASSRAYRLLLDGARFADAHDFSAIWTPERHFHAFGGLYPNPAVTSAAVAAVTSRIQIRAGSVVLPLHDPIRVAEEWAVVDNLSQGRVGLSFASGWHANDFALKPENYERRREVMQESIDTVLRLWAGEKIKVRNGNGDEIEVSVLPRPVRERPPMWIASAGNIETFRAAGRSGHNVLTNMLGQDIDDLRNKFAAYREARKESGHEGDGVITVMLHTFVTDDDDKARELARGPFGNYLKTSYDLVKVAPWMFPAFKQPSLADSGATSAFDPSRFDESDMAALLDHAFDRYFDTAGLFGTPQRALRLVEQLKDIGANEMACLIDFGIDHDVVLDNLVHLDALRRLANPAANSKPPAEPVSVKAQFERRAITHLQCTPSMARMLVADGTLASMGSLKKFLLGGEALPADLAGQLSPALGNTEFLNMYGPTETTVWSTSARVGRAGEPITIGRPIANTQIRILDARGGLLPIGTAGELCIGGAGVVRGYLGRADLTAERFIDDPFLAGNRLYRTGDLARFREDGRIDYIGRIDQQVKVNGYRIELGEIETVLGRHPAVKEAVVAVKEGAMGAELVGYVIAAGTTDAPAGSGAAVGDWQRRWDEAYTQRAGAAGMPARLDTSGWLSSTTGEPIAPEQMREWLDHTVARVLALKPKRVLEIGCGTGMILYACLPHVEHYTGVDVSPSALERIRAELDSAERAKVTLVNQPAHLLEGLADQRFDLVVINSVAQYFPGADYLAQVLDRASRLLVDGGKVFLGDVRSLEEMQAFHTLVELQKAPGQLAASALAGRVAERAKFESELLLDGAFFGDLAQRVPRLGLVSMQLKRGLHANEMRDFRFDVVLQAGAALVPIDMARVQRLDAPTSVAGIRAALATRPPMLLLDAVRNGRLDRLHDVVGQMRAADCTTTVDMLRHALESAAVGIDPAALMDLDAAYDVEVRFGRKAGTVDALMRRRDATPAGVWAAPAVAPQAPLVHEPRARMEPERLAAQLKAHLKDFLPDYMVPRTFVPMTAFALTPNGKIDRKALPTPAEKPRQVTAEDVVPGNDLERTIAGIWCRLLGVDQVGRRDNIFDLGASSLLTVEANNQLQAALGQKIPLVTMFRFPTIESLAGHIARTLAPPAGASATTMPQDVAERDRQDRLEAAAARRRRARAQAV
jgi:natural product biosynthesis luciferase-like monooxygenase protein